ncbi:hypothetical protein GTW43_30715 [Streptomyces sp. SID5785]|uniref:FAD-dependent oxidoreductase n=1 Tax=Streptomyces sp. SID5785 TaxID=2690309 RepID=UPI0013614581|nr:FAD-dependent oxidoreductase [Streptomyces sp. SID5785]MZD09421.1 hypothetical protein [Streptomyces sp. SID5785]
MTSVAIIGGSVVGCAAALQFARSGRQVTLIDPDLGLMSGPAAQMQRAGAQHAAQPHGLMSRAYVELADRLPDIVAELARAGAPLVPLAAMIPPALCDGGRPHDDRLATVRTRRVTLDRVLARAVGHEASIVTRPVRATGLEVDAGAPPRVHGVRLADGSTVPADLVLDTTGRRSPVPRWLTEAGYAQPETLDRCDVSYYGRHYRLRPGQRPALNTGFGDIHGFPTHLQLMFLGDSDTAMVALCVPRGDPLMKSLRHSSAFDAVLAANDDFAHWMSLLEATTPVFATGAHDNRMRSMTVDGRPLVRGLHQAGDALATTNPTRGRGIAMGLAAVGHLHDLVVDGHHGDDLTLAYAEWQERVLAVYYREAVASDTHLSRRLQASVHNGPHEDHAPANAHQLELPPAHPASSAQIERAARHDPDLLRNWLRAVHMLDDGRDIASFRVAEQTHRTLTALPPPVPRPQRDGGLHDPTTLRTVLQRFAQDDAT